MNFFAVLSALLLGQLRPLAWNHPLSGGPRAWALSLARAGTTWCPRMPWLTWSVTVLVPALAALLVYQLLWHGIGWPLALLWHVALLYLTLGLRQLHDRLTGIRHALKEEDKTNALAQLADWYSSTGSLPQGDVQRDTATHAALSAHRHIFGVLAWYVLPAALGLGPTGAVLYRVAECLPRHWQDEDDPSLCDIARQAWQVMDWLPARFTACTFALVGNFDAANQGWQAHAEKYPHDSDGLVLAAAAGAAPLSADNIVTLLWRSLAVWMLLLAFLALTSTAQLTF